MSKDLTALLIAGCISSLLFMLVFGVGLGFMFMFVPTLPLLSVGLAHGERTALGAALLGAVIISIVDAPAGLLFLLFFGLPVWYIVRFSLLSVNLGGARWWFPIGWVFLRLTLYACALLALITLYYTSQPGGLPAVLALNVHQAFAELEDQYGEIITLLANQWSFLIFPVTIWMWGLALYIHAWLANWLLTRRTPSAAIRPDFAITLFPMPNWMFSLLGICALASLIGSESLRFLANGTLLTLMLPYFFLGAALLNARSAHWTNRRFLLFLIYFFIFTLIWPALVFSAMGLWHHLKFINKHLSSDGTSSKS